MGEGKSFVGFKARKVHYIKATRDKLSSLLLEDGIRERLLLVFDKAVEFK
jgi:hypothetical protein